MITHHAIARIHQTFDASFSEIATKLKKELEIIEQLQVHFHFNYNEQDKTYAILSNKGVLLCVWDDEDEVVTVKTAIAIDSMNTPVRDMVEDALDLNKRYIHWKDEG